MGTMSSLIISTSNCSHFSFDPLDPPPSPHPLIRFYLFVMFNVSWGKCFKYNRKWSVQCGVSWTSIKYQNVHILFSMWNAYLIDLVIMSAVEEYLAVFCVSPIVQIVSPWIFRRERCLSLTVQPARVTLPIWQPVASSLWKHIKTVVFRIGMWHRLDNVNVPFTDR